MIARLTLAVRALHDQPQLLLMLAALFWAGNAIAGQLAAGHITPFQLVLLRWAGVTLMMWPLFGAEVIAHWATARARLARIVLMAILGFTGFNALFYIASLRTSGVNIGILQGSIPVFVMIGAFALHGTRVGTLQAMGVGATLCGVALVATQGTPLDVLDVVVNQGDLLMLLACSLYAGYAILLQGRPAIPGAVFFTLMAPIAFATAVPLALYEALQPGYALPTARGWMITAFVAVFPSCLSQLFFLRAVDLIGPGRAGVYTNLVPVFASLFAVVLLGQIFAPYHGAALVLVIGGIVLAQQAPRA